MGERVMDMRRFLVILLACLMVCSSASANQWGLTGELLGALIENEDYDAYSARCEVVTENFDAAVMESRYHNTLMVAVNRGSAWQFMGGMTKAVYQLGDGKDDDVKLTATENGFTLSYDGEWYEFALEDAEAGEDLFLARAQIGDFTLTHAENPERGYLCEDAAGSALWDSGRIALKDFNIRLTPRSTAEVKHLNELRGGRLGQWPCLEKEGTHLNRVGEGLVPVYSAPDEASWRAAMGKAAVSLKGGMDVLGPADKEWSVIRYDVSLATQRIGCVPTKSINQGSNAGTIYTSVPLTVNQSTYLTDDPDRSQFRQSELDKGAALTALGYYDNYYAYVETAVDGQPARGFVPLAALDLPADDTLTDVMAQASGEWALSGGGSMHADYKVLSPDGTFRGYDYNWDHVPEDILDNPPSQAPDGDQLARAYTGTWRVTRNDPSRKAYWEKAPYIITFTCDDGTSRSFGMEISVDEAGRETLGLYWGEGGGGYLRVK